MGQYNVQQRSGHNHFIREGRFESKADHSCSPVFVVRVVLNHSHQPPWALFEKKKRYALPGTLARTRLNWWYSENFCLENNTNQLHIYTNNYTHYLYLNRSTTKLRIPHDVSNYRHALRVFVHHGDLPSNRTILENLYVVINRGWNNMYHHSETAIQIVRYALFGSNLPPVGAVCYPIHSIDEQSCPVSGY